MIFASGFSWWHLIPGVEDNTLFAGLGIHSHSYVVVGAWVSCLVLVVMALIGRMGLESAKRRNGIEKYFADDRLNARTMAEVFVSGIQGMMSDVLGRDDVSKFTWLIAGLFSYVFISNIQAIFPGFQPPTDNINTNVGMALVSFIAFMSVALGRDPVGFIKHLMGPVIILAPLLFVIETIGLVVRPMSLSIRLTGNIFGDHTVFNIMHGLLPWFVPAIFLGLAVVVSVIQAFVFSLLSTIYIGLSVPHDDHGDH